MKRTIDPSLFRELTARTLLFHQAVADRLGLGLTDHKVIDLLSRHGEPERVTPGSLAELTGLTTGAITGVLDRLEAAGFVRREKDPSDRRQVIVQLLPGRLEELGALFGPMAASVDELCADFTPRELERITEFVQRAIEIAKRETERLRAEGPSRARAADELTLPRGSLTAAVFEAKRGAHGLTLGACDDPHLFTSKHEGNPPVLELARDVLSFSPGKTGALDWLRSKRSWARLDLSRRVAWTVRVKNGASGVDADLRELTIESVRITGGVEKTTLRLGHPTGLVPVRVSGGAASLRIGRPKHVAMRLTVHGGAAGLAIDAMKLGAVGGVARWESPEVASAANVFDVDVSGGATELIVETMG